MTNSLYETISSTVREHPIIFGIICTAISIFITLEILLVLGKGIHSELITYPLFAGAIFSWAFAVLATGIVLLFAYINRNKKEQYKNVLEKSKKWLIGISIVVIFYISINLASEALTGTGVPMLSEPYQILHFTNVTYQDVILISLVFLIIFLLFLVAPRYNKNRRLIFVFVIIVLIALLFSPLFFFHYNKEDIPETYSFSWSSVPGNNDEKLRMFLNDVFDIDWAKNAEISKFNGGMTINITQDENFAEIMMDKKKEKATLKISDGRTYELKVKPESGTLNIYYSETTQKGKSEQILLFGVFTVVSFLIAVLLLRIMPKEAKDENLRDLLIYFSIIPAFIVASLVLIEHPLVTYSNFTGHMVVGFLFISGFATLVILTRIQLKDVKNGMRIWGFTVFASLAAISFLSAVFLLLEGFIHQIGTFRNFLTFSIVIILVILQYSFAYEQLLKYRFTEWWRRELKPIAMIIAIFMILIVSALNPKDVELKLFVIFLVLLFVLGLPWIMALLRFWKDREPGEYKLPRLLIPWWYLFSWDDVPVEDSERRRLLMSLRHKYNIDWAENAEICKSDDGKTIRISKDEKSAEIMIAEKEKEAVLNTSDGRTYPLKVKRENGRLNIYMPKMIPPRFKLPKFLPQYQGMVLVKADPGSLKKVVNELEGMKGVYQTMVVRGEYDVCLTVEGVSSGDIEKKILKIRKIDGIASTTTLTDIREFFDKER